MAWRAGSIFMWLYRLRKLNGPNYTWPLMMFAGVAPERALQAMGKIHAGKPLASKSRRELIATLRPNYLKHLRADNGDLPEGFIASIEDASRESAKSAAAGTESFTVLP